MAAIIYFPVDASKSLRMDHDEFVNRLNQPSPRFSSDPSLETRNRFLAIEATVADRLATVGYSSLVPHEKAIHNVFCLVAEVMSGGFHQYFFNSAGDYVLDTLKSLRSIGSNETLTILSDACSLFPGSRPNPDRLERQSQLETFEEADTGDLSETYEDAFDALDQRFHDRTEDLYALCLIYWDTTHTTEGPT